MLYLDVEENLLRVREMTNECQGERMLRGGYLEGQRPPDGLARVCLPIWRRLSRGQNRLRVFQTSEVSKGEHRQVAHLLSLFTGIFQRHVDEEEDIASFGGAEVLALTRFHTVDSDFPIPITSFDGLANAEMLRTLC